jgi:hypothetical protein
LVNGIPGDIYDDRSDRLDDPALQFHIGLEFAVLRIGTIMLPLDHLLIRDRSVSVVRPIMIMVGTLTSCVIPGFIVPLISVIRTSDLSGSSMIASSYTYAESAHRQLQ